MERWFFALGAVAGLTAVALGAFAAHALRGKLPPDLLDVFDVGARYHMYHALALLGVVVASANGVLAWRRTDVSDDPVLTVLGGEESRPERLADSRHLRHLRCFGDVGFGAQTIRDHPRLVPTPQEPGDPPMPALYA